MSNVPSHSLPETELFSALDGRSRKLTLKAWPRSRFGPHRKIPTTEPLKTQKATRSQWLARATGAARVVPASGRRRIFKISTSRVLQTGETPRNQAFADRRTASSPEPPKNKKIERPKLCKH
jgi:hypothetical protein